MTTNVRISGYGDYSGSYGTNAMQVQLGGLRIWFSYQTPVAFSDSESGLVVRQNDWGPTTGKHLNWIDNGNHAGRVSGSMFQEMLSQAIRRESAGIVIEVNQ